MCEDCDDLSPEKVEEQETPPSASTPPEDEESNIYKYVIGGVVAGAVGVLGWKAMGGRGLRGGHQGRNRDIDDYYLNLRRLENEWARESTMNDLRHHYATRPLQRNIFAPDNQEQIYKNKLEGLGVDLGDDLE